MASFRYNSRFNFKVISRLDMSSLGRISHLLFFFSIYSIIFDYFESILFSVATFHRINLSLFYSQNFYIKYVTFYFNFLFRVFFSYLYIFVSYYYFCLHGLFFHCYICFVIILPCYYSTLITS